MMATPQEKAQAFDLIQQHGLGVRKVAGGYIVEDSQGRRLQLSGTHVAVTDPALTVLDAASDRARRQAIADERSCRRLLEDVLELGYHAVPVRVPVAEGGTTLLWMLRDADGRVLSEGHESAREALGTRL